MRAELTALKSGLVGSARNANAQFAAIADRLDRVERVTANPSTQLSQDVRGLSYRMARTVL